MSAQSDRITEVLREHEVMRDPYRQARGCICDGWADVDGSDNGHYTHAAHVASVLEAELQLTEQWGHAIIHSGGLVDANVNVYFTERDARRSMGEINKIFPDDRRRVVHRFGGSRWSPVPEEQP